MVPGGGGVTGRHVANARVKTAAGGDRQRAHRGFPGVLPGVLRLVSAVTWIGRVTKCMPTQAHGHQYRTHRGHDEQQPGPAPPARSGHTLLRLRGPGRRAGRDPGVPAMPGRR